MARKRLGTRAAATTRLDIKPLLHGVEAHPELQQLCMEHLRVVYRHQVDGGREREIQEIEHRLNEIVAEVEAVLK
jgi:hypothetical protein